ncbi:glucose-6-phosphate isomerase [Halalkalibacterium halodurans]|jgi:glucose-6-phosphate isomerase|uniref:Glucose-6-phosphate isomerase n=2 Tax=Halalkalibacterium halodurans TaxID=86665 RepID=G6PI_HALH5|nr:glucose-6-phosphate isomerase [Halalkalibacterium halodurans]Q9K7L8.1 RecName: Full=Glucose-6-phosphate isomerase; Short=GPI; AltName: Full=Phosphoglucose isomerase; Short=PGI; AltName: Full=Phosphohexose isomerase; Short=PHI [Halalkalibacterium halodurans C-125]MDY7223875.1 glucose-6-phosphate isomerase [Halalkalibacterium halodurans]MDY7243096.1 glucose-6-phosphate isomerase [Halalkalibacterium halodurans]MED3647148.1 glucose-6-phosphate isomerase [Halalkalibacterium halodurans]MED4080619
MSGKVCFDYSKALDFIQEHELDNLQDQVHAAHRALHDGTGAGNDFLGWIDLPVNYDREEFSRIQKAAEKIRNDSDVLLVIGIGGSYLGAKATLEALNHSFYNIVDKSERKGPQIFFVGHHISSTYVQELFDVLEGKDVSINVISKSGTTTEPAIAFRIFRDYLEKKYGKEESRKRIYATTDRERGALKTLANEEGYESFIIPDDVGGRFSVLTAVGLLPIAASGLDIEAMMKGAADARDAFRNSDLKENPAYQYAVVRNALYNKGKTIELMVNYEPALQYFSEWWKQLYGESEGKDGKGIFPASVNFSTDLHSMGQYVQDGRRDLFETIIQVEKPKKNMTIEKADQDLDGLNYLAGETMDFVNKKAFEGTLLAHVDGGVPNLVVSVPELDEYYMGYLMYFFEKACGLSGYLLGVNPFDQPGVEAYKKNMFALLGKPGFEEQKAALEKRLK